MKYIHAPEIEGASGLIMKNILHNFLGQIDKYYTMLIFNCIYLLHL